MSLNPQMLLAHFYLKFTTVDDGSLLSHRRAVAFTLFMGILLVESHRIFCESTGKRITRLQCEAKSAERYLEGARERVKRFFEMMENYTDVMCDVDIIDTYQRLLSRLGRTEQLYGRVMRELKEATDS